MSAIEEIGRLSPTGRALYFLEVLGPAEVPDISLGSPNFGALVLWDVTGIDPIQLVDFGSKLVNDGATYFSCWGPECETLHDAIDYAALDSYDDEIALMTTWHSEESLEDTIWFFLNAALPQVRVEPTTKSMIAICIGNSEWAAECRQAFLNPEGFSEKVLEKDESAV